MPEFSEVLVGDIVTLRNKTYPRTTLTGEVRETQPDGLHILGHGWAIAFHWEITDLQPKPFVLPTVPGAYSTPRQMTLFRLDEKGQWWCDASGQWSVILPEMRKYIPQDLMRLVPESAVEEARTKVVKEIVAMLRYDFHDLSAYEIERKFLGGKA